MAMDLRDSDAKKHFPVFLERAEGHVHADPGHWLEAAGYRKSIVTGAQGKYR